MNPKLWGPSAWVFLHYVTMDYPKNPTKQDKHAYRIFFTSLEHVLPCDKCSHNYSNNLRKLSLESALESRDKLIRWLIGIHNEVNKETDKPSYTYEQVIDEYNYKMNKSESDETSAYKIIIICLLLLLLLLGYKFTLSTSK